MKHITKYVDHINENVGRDSVLFIKGKAEDEGRKLFATHINGYSEFKPGVRMFFLPQDFYRIKIGIGRPDASDDIDHDRDFVVDHVLSDFSKEEEQLIKVAIDRAAWAVECIMAKDITTAMNQFN